MSLNENNGIVEIPSNHSVDETVATVKQILDAQGVTLFALIDHSGEAEKVGMKMPATKLLIFGNPKAGTPVMLAAPASAIDLPLKLLIREDAQGKVWVTYNSPEYLRRRYDLPQNVFQNIAVVEALARKAGGYGGTQSLRYEDAPEPSPGSGEVLVRVHAAGVTPTELSWQTSRATRSGTRQDRSSSKRSERRSRCATSEIAKTPCQSGSSGSRSIPLSISGSQVRLLRK